MSWRLIDVGSNETSNYCSNKRILFLFMIFVIFLCIFYSLISKTNLIGSININYINLTSTKVNTADIIDVKKEKLKSPFFRTLAFIRWNAPFHERIPIMEKYRPFFAELHYSIPGYASKVNYTVDGWTPIADPYKPVAETMQIILENYPIIEGLLYFHFDAWIQPLNFSNMTFTNIWYLADSFPPFKCVTNTSGWDWWVWKDGFHNVAKAATRTVAEKYSGRFQTNKDVFCGGWSDIYYIPRRFFQDYIDLTSVFQAAGSFHEVAIPTMVNIIDLTYRRTSLHSIITRLIGCWGHCCASGSQPNDIKQRRCGHRMDLNNEVIRKTLMDLLDAQANYLNKTNH